MPSLHEHLSSLSGISVQKVLRAVCSALGVSGRGGKAKCLQRMVGHVRAQALIAAHGVEVRLRGELERQPVAQSRPEEPSQAEVENHSLMSHSSLGAAYAISIVHVKINMLQATMNLPDIQWYRLFLVFAAEWMEKPISRLACLCTTGRPR